jgi:hypothetical protein
MSGINVDDKIRGTDDPHASAGITHAELEEFVGLPVNHQTMRMIEHKIRSLLWHTTIRTHTEIKDGWINIWFSYDDLEYIRKANL